MATTTRTHSVTLDEATRARLGRRAQLLAGASVTYNVIEAVVAVTAGLVAFSFFALAGYVTFESVRALLGSADPDPSPVGIGLAAASLVIMPSLSWAQRRTGRALGSNAVVADSTQTLLCTYLSAVLLVGLVLNATLGWSWADPLAGLIIAAVAVTEGRDAWRGEGCCAPGGTGHADGSGCGDGCTDACCTPAASGDAPATATSGRSLANIEPVARSHRVDQD